MNVRAVVRDTLVFGTLVGCVAAGAHLISQIEVPVPTGVWKDVDEHYYVVFSEESSTYVESIYNVPRSYEVEDGVLTMQDMSGQSYAVELNKGLPPTIAITLNGKDRLLQQVSDVKPKLFRWSESPSSDGTLDRVYDLKSSQGERYSLKLYSDMVYELVMSSDVTSGKYSFTETGELLLFVNGGELVESLIPWGRGFAIGQMESTVKSSTLQANPIKTRGLLLEGSARTTSTGLHYMFRGDNIVTLSKLDGSNSMDFAYFVDPDGLITITDTVGLGITDYLYYDSSRNRVYRYVFESDGWFDYLSGTGGI